MNKPLLKAKLDQHVNIINVITKMNPKALFADGLSEAVIGMTESHTPKPIYSKEQCIAVMMRDNNWDYETAMEFLEFNTFGAYVGEQTPLFVNEFTEC